MKFLYISIVLISLPLSLISQTKSALFIGNSYTGVNNLPTMTKDLALSLEDTLVIDSNTPGGTTLTATQITPHHSLKLAKELGTM
jgi:hypothetical protein